MLQNLIHEGKVIDAADLGREITFYRYQNWVWKTFKDGIMLHFRWVSSADSRKSLSYNCKL